MRKKPIIAIDGFTSSGKTTTSRELAKRLDFKHINTGAIYRVVARVMLDKGVSETCEDEIIKIAESVNIDFEIKNGKSIVLVDGKDWMSRIYTPEIVSFTSKIAIIKSLREVLIPLQRKLGSDGGIVMEGRDIASVIFPDAEWKFFITAAFEVRVKRMKKLYSSKGIRLAKDEYEKKLREIDFKDTTRSVAPLIQTEDAIYYDNSNSPSEHQDAIILEYYINNCSEIIRNSKRLEKMADNNITTSYSNRSTLTK